MVLPGNMESPGDGSESGDVETGNAVSPTPDLVTVTVPGCQGCPFLGPGSLLKYLMLMFEGAAEVRLADGSGRCDGRVEVKHQNRWGTVCRVSWDEKDAAVVCKQLGCGSVISAARSKRFVLGSGPIWMDEVHCRGTESALSDCTQTEWCEQYCTHSDDAGVTCTGEVLATPDLCSQTWGINK